MTSHSLCWSSYYIQIPCGLEVFCKIRLDDSVDLEGIADILGVGVAKDPPIKVY